MRRTETPGGEVTPAEALKVVDARMQTAKRLSALRRSLVFAVPLMRRRGRRGL
jgi:hypothetical protein